MKDLEWINQKQPVQPPLCDSRKYPYLPHGRSLEILIGWGGGGVLKANLLEEKYEAKLEFPGG